MVTPQMQSATVCCLVTYMNRDHDRSRHYLFGL